MDVNMNDQNFRVNQTTPIPPVNQIPPKGQPINNGYMPGQLNQVTQPAPNPYAENAEKARQRYAMLNAKRLSDFGNYGLWSLIYGIIFCLFMYKSAIGGISHTLFIIISLFYIALIDARSGKTVCYAPKCFILERNGKPGVRLFYLISIILLAVSQFLTASFTLHILTGFGMQLLIGCLFYRSYVDATGNNPARIAGALIRLIFLPLINIFEPFLGLLAFHSSKKTLTAKDIEKKKNRQLILAGIVIALPVVLIIVCLLASADLIFASVLKNLEFNFDITEQFFDVIGIIFWFFVSAITIYSIFAELHPNNNYFKSASNAASNKWNPLLMIPMELILTVIYIIFCAIQLIFLIGHASLPNGYTYAEYAHEGFYQLLFVCMINILIAAIVRSKFDKTLFLNILTIIICLCTFLMIFSSAYRMILYVTAYDLSFLRFFVLWFLIVLTVCLTILTIGLLAKNVNVAKNCLIAGTCLYIVFAFIKPDYWIARYNVNSDNYESSVTTESGRTSNYDSAYISDHLSVDAIPALIEARDYDTAAKLISYRHNFAYKYKQESLLNKIRDFNLSDHIADNIIFRE